jgi:periplasmic protein TonB
MKRLFLALGAGLLLVVQAAAFATTTSMYFSEPLPAMQKVSAAADARAYRIDAARTVYEAYAPRVFKGRLPPLIHAVVVVETTVDGSGRPREVKVVRGPSHAPDVTEAVVEMIRRINLPAHGNSAGFRFTEIWLVTKDGRFQLDSLTEGQN